MSRDAHAIRLASGLLFMKSTIRERSTCKNTFIVRCLDSWFLQRYSASCSDAWRDSRSFLRILCVCVRACVCACVRACVCVCGVCVCILLALYVSFRCSFSSYIRPPHLVSSHSPALSIFVVRTPRSLPLLSHSIP